MEHSGAFKKTLSRNLRNAVHLSGVLVILLGLFASASVASAASAASSSRQQLFVSAAQEFNVPQSVLLALSYNQSRWETSAGMSVDGGYGLMDLRTYTSTVISGRDGSQIAAPAQPASHYTLDQAAQLLHLPKDVLKTSDQDNVRGAAAVLAQDARQLNNGTLPTSVDGWYAAVAEFGGATNLTSASIFANSVYATIKSGATVTTTDGQAMSLPSLPSVQPNTSSLSQLGLKALPTGSSNVAGGLYPECPSTLNCRFIPAAYEPDSSTDPTNYGNYDIANRPTDGMPIKYLYIHDGEGSYDSIINHFQDPTAYDSAQYVISTQGDVTQMVSNEDVSWGVANWNMNMQGINIEHAGFAARGASWYTPAMYQASATLVRWLANKYHIPLDRQHILGHDNIMYALASGQAIQHWDPGPYWNWTYFMDLVRGESLTQAATDYLPQGGLSPLVPIRKGDVVKIVPHFAANQQTVTDCTTSATLPTQGTNFVYLHTQPSGSAPLLSDPYLHTDGSAGTTQDCDWGDKAPSGLTYVVADVQGNWVGIWYAGQEGWFYNPSGSGQAARVTDSKTVTPKPGVSSIPVYTNAYPEASAYPSAIPVQPQSTAYSMNAGQSYATPGDAVTSEYFYDATYNYSFPDDHMIVIGTQKYYEITFNHHIGFVKVEDVVVHT